MFLFNVNDIINALLENLEIYFWSECIEIWKFKEKPPGSF